MTDALMHVFNFLTLMLGDEYLSCIFSSPEYSLFVGDLTAEVDDGMLYEFFVEKYPSCRGGKVVLDNLGNSKYVVVSDFMRNKFNVLCI